MIKNYLINNPNLYKIYLLLLSIQITYDFLFQLLIDNSNESFANYYQISHYIFSKHLLLLSVIASLLFMILLKLASNSQNNKNKNIKVDTIFYFFVLFYIIGRNYHYKFSLIELIQYIPLIILSIYLYRSLTILILTNIITNLQNYKINFKLSLSVKKYYNYYIRHIFILSFIIILLFWSPYFYFYYPGSIQWDGLAQLNQFFGIRIWDNHYPAISTMIIGYIFETGKYIIDDNFGIFLFTISQSIFSALVFSYTLKFIASINTSSKFIVISLIFYAIFPIWPMNSYTFVKDTYYYLFFLLLFIQLIKVVLLKDDSLIRYSLILLFGSLIWIFRNDGYYVIILSLIGLTLHKLSKRNLVYSISIILVIFSLNKIYHSYFLPKNNIFEGSVREMLSLPMQQTARFCNKNYELISLEEDSVITNIFSINCQALGREYNAETSDNIKVYFKYNPTKNELDDYFGVWLSMFIKNPTIYIDAFLSNYYGYIYPLKHEYKDGIAWYTVQYSEQVYTGDFNLFMLDHRKLGRDIIEYITNLFRNMPIIELIFNVGSYTWLLVYFLIIKLKRKDLSYIVVSLPLLLTLLVCLVSPVNAYVRYMLPIIVSTPLIFNLIKLENCTKL